MIISTQALRQPIAYRPNSETISAMSIRRSIFANTRRAYSATSRASFAEVIEGPKYLTVNFCTPHESIFVKKLVEKVTVPGEGGDVGLTFGHSPIICQLRPGVMTFCYIDGTTEKFFVPGGFAVGHKDQEIADVSVPEVFKSDDFDHSLVRANYDTVKRAYAAAPLMSHEASSTFVQLNALATLARFLEIDLEKV